MSGGHSSELLLFGFTFSSLHGEEKGIKTGKDVRGFFFFLILLLSSIFHL
jgi:hypothetical protein